MEVHIYLLISAITTIFFYIYLRILKKMKKSSIPGPLSLPFFGTKWQSIDMSKLHEYFDGLNRKYGDVVMEVSGNFPIVSIFKRKDIEKVLSTPSQYPFRPPNEIQSFYRMQNPNRYSSTGIGNEQGPEWLKLRTKLSLKTLENRKFHEAFCSDLNEICSDFNDVIRSVRNDRNEIINFHENMRAMSFETNCFFVLGKRGYGKLEGSEKIAKLTDANMKIMEAIRDTYYGTQFWKYFPTKAYKTFAESEEMIYDVISDIIENILIDDAEKASDTEVTSILEKVVSTEGLDMKDKICGIVDFLSGSTEAKTATIMFLLYHISEHPEVQDKIYKEASSLNEHLTAEDLKKAYYTRAVLYETFRLTPTAPALARILENDFELSGHHVKSGTFVLCQTMVACLKEENFDDANSFKPDRWLNTKGEFDTSNLPGSSLVLPFGTGKRACPGRKFAEVELIAIIIKLVRAFKITYESRFEKVFKFIMTPEFPVHMKFEDR
ncbi:ecdysone 20-monooxygenase-like [Chironomus tepperi]|uniref:ecdysone 20-monooxygenase-like n=1 Tax=Chironomus tepperi TaxID=113505 RepID=UPI00391FA34F